MEFDKLDPSLLGVCGAIFIIREVFSFLKAKARAVDPVTKAMLRTLDDISRHIEAQTDLIKGFSFEIREVRRDLEQLKIDLRRK